MVHDTLARDDEGRPGSRLTGIYVRTTLWYLIAVLLLWLAGFESVYGRLTPFDAVYQPAFHSILVPGAVVLCLWAAYRIAPMGGAQDPLRRRLLGWGLWLALLATIAALFYQEAANRSQSPGRAIAAAAPVLLGHLTAFGLAGTSVLLLPRLLGKEGEERSPWAVYGLLPAFFALAVAASLLRGGPASLWEAHSLPLVRAVEENGGPLRFVVGYPQIIAQSGYAGRGSGPGEGVFAWLVWRGAGQSAAAAGLLSAAFLSLSVLGLYAWAKEQFLQRTALIAACLYSLVPGVVLLAAGGSMGAVLPFALLALFFFVRGRGRNAGWFLAAGVFLALAAFVNLSAIGLFAYCALWVPPEGSARQRAGRHARALLATAAAALMTWFWLAWGTGFDLVACWHGEWALSHGTPGLDALTPRAPYWLWKLLNPAAWFFYAGVPVSLLFLWSFRGRVPGERRQWGNTILVLVFLNLLFLPSGGAELGAVYVYPLLVLPAAAALARLEAENGTGPLIASLCYLAFQCWLAGSYFQPGV